MPILQGALPSQRRVNERREARWRPQIGAAGTSLWYYVTVYDLQRDIAPPALLKQVIAHAHIRHRSRLGLSGNILPTGVSASACGRVFHSAGGGQDAEDGTGSIPQFAAL
jgi:hypothetical protein